MEQAKNEQDQLTINDDNLIQLMHIGTYIILHPSSYEIDYNIFFFLKVSLHSKRGLVSELTEETWTLPVLSPSP